MTACALVLTAVVSPRPASADWHLAPFAGIKFGGSTTLIDLDRKADTTKIVYGGTVTFVGHGLFGVEGDVGIIPNYLQKGQQAQVKSSLVLTAMGNVVVTAPLGWTRDSLRPYVSGGAGLIRVSMDDALNLLPYQRTLGGYNVGGGVVGFLTPFTGVKWDLRYFKGWGPGGEGTTFGSARIAFWRATMAVVLRY